MIAEIAFPVPLRRTFSYRVGDGILACARPGLRVVAPFGPRNAAGMIMRLHDDSVADLSGIKEIKTIDALLDAEPPIKDDVPEIAFWMQDRWNAPVGMAVESFFGPFMGSPLPPALPPGGEGPTAVSGEGLSGPLAELCSRLSGGGAAAHVLFGPPQDGRYEVYSELIRKAVTGGGQVLCLVPDLNLIPPLEERLRKIIKPESFAVWHSRLSPAQRRAAWHGVKNGTTRVVLGARSAAFLPFGRLDLALIDEEQDDIYKAEEQEPNFHARELLLKRASYHGTRVVLASAAPSMEAYSRAGSGSFSWNALPASALERTKVSIVDMTSRGWEPVSSRLGEKLSGVVAGKKQALVLAGRKGYASLAPCANCGWIKRCGRCRVPMGTLKDPEGTRFVCRRCGRKEPMPEICPACSGRVFRESGAGTQRIEAYLKKLLPGARVARCDGDVVRRSVKDARLVYESFRRGEIDVLVGTRLLARGHDFPNLGAVGVVDSDAGLSAADFRASEKIFQTLLEAGAALSGTLAPDPELIVQTRQPGHYVFSVLPGLDYMKFAANELEARKNFFYPPFSELISVTISSVEAAAVSSFSEEMLRSLDCASGEAGAEILGPIVLGEPKRSRTVKESYLVKLPGEKELAECLARLRRLKPPKKVRMKVTADPYSFR